MRCYSRLLIIIALGLSASRLYAQDTIPKFSWKNLSLFVRGGLIYQGSPYGEVSLSDYQKREIPDTVLYGGIRYATNKNALYVGDEPLIHGASYIDIGGTFASSGFLLNARILAEHAGMSYGVYTKNAISVYSKYLFSLDTAIAVFGHRLGFAVSAGNYDNLRSEEGTTIYNLDAQGSRWTISFDKLNASYQKIADLVEWIGLNIDDGNIWSLKLDSVKILDDLFITPEYSFFDYATVRYSNPNLYDFGNSYSLRVMHSSGIAAYAELSQRASRTSLYNLSDCSAYLVGSEYSTKNKWFDLNAHAEYRHYGKAFNLAFYDNSQVAITNGSYYYLNNRYTLGSNFLYPVQLYERPFSQWAVFTEYQGLAVSGFTLFIDMKVPIYSGIFFKGNLDWNLITAQGEAPFIYPFYDAGFGWQPFEGVYALYTYTNRTMNLTKPYPTLFLYKSPTSQMTLHWDLRF